MLGGRPGLFNPDNAYQMALLEPGASYRISGPRGSHLQLYLQILDDPTVTALGQSRGAFDVNALGIEAGEDFGLYLGGAERDEHWLPLASDAKALIVRMTFADWERKTPSALRIERLDGAVPPAADGAASRLDRAAAPLDGAVRLWLGSFAKRMESGTRANQMNPLRPTPGGLAGQYSSSGRFELADDEALVITVSRSPVQYQGIQLGDPWFVSPDWARGQVSLNHAQARTDADGKLRFVVSRRDPGVQNWLDTGGLSRGYVFMRWQGATSKLTDVHGPSARRVKLAELPGALPADTPRFDARARAEQLRARRFAPSRK